jgi:hypothetical protein
MWSSGALALERARPIRRRGRGRPNKRSRRRTQRPQCLATTPLDLRASHAIPVAASHWPLPGRRWAWRFASKNIPCSRRGWLGRPDGRRSFACAAGRGPAEARCGGANISIGRRGPGRGHGQPLTPARPWIYSRFRCRSPPSTLSPRAPADVPLICAVIPVHRSPCSTHPRSRGSPRRCCGR